MVGVEAVVAREIGLLSTEIVSESRMDTVGTLVLW